MAMIKSLKRKFGISAPRVAVRPHIPWYLRWLALTVLAALALVLAWGMYDAGRKFAGFDKNELSQELERLSASSARLQQENEALRMRLAGLDRQSQMEIATREDLARQVKALGDENNRLREDLAFFQNLVSGSGKASEGVSVYRFKLERGQMPGEYRYSLLLVQGGQRPKDFQGSLEFLVNMRQNGTKAVMPLPGDGSRKDKDKAFSVSFKFYQRVQGSFRVPPETVVDGLQVQVFENGVAQSKLTQVANLS